MQYTHAHTHKPGTGNCVFFKHWYFIQIFNSGETGSTPQATSWILSSGENSNLDPGKQLCTCPTPSILKTYWFVGVKSPILPAKRAAKNTLFHKKMPRKDQHWLNTLTERQQKVHRVERPVFLQVPFERLLLHGCVQLSFPRRAELSVGSDCTTCKVKTERIRLVPVNASSRRVKSFERQVRFKYKGKLAISKPQKITTLSIRKWRPERPFLWEHQRQN